MKLSSIIYNMRQQPVISAVSIIGTALAIFLIMTVVMMGQIKVMSIPPEANRDRTLQAIYICVEDSTRSQSSGGLSLLAINELFSNLDHVEYVGIDDSNGEKEVSAFAKGPIMCITKKANADFFKIMQYDYIEGAPYTKSDVESGQKVAVINETVARTLFDGTDVVNSQIMINRRPYRISAVIKDVNPITPLAYAEVFTPIPTLEEDMMENEEEEVGYQYLGDYRAVLLVEDSKYITQIKAETESRYSTLNDMLGEFGVSVKYFGAPYTQEEAVAVESSNYAPNTEGAKRRRIGIYAILLLVPAINLSSITQNRLRQRVSEIGLKRAFGSTKTRIMAEMFTENLLYTLFGAILGLVLSILASWLFADFLFMERMMWYLNIKAEASFSPLTMLSWNTFFWAALFCLLLNVLSCGIPVFMASRVNPAEAINGHLD